MPTYTTKDSDNFDGRGDVALEGSTSSGGFVWALLRGLAGNYVTTNGNSVYSKFSDATKGTRMYRSGATYGADHGAQIIISGAASFSGWKAGIIVGASTDVDPNDDLTAYYLYDNASVYLRKKKLVNGAGSESGNLATSSYNPAGSILRVEKIGNDAYIYLDAALLYHDIGVFTGDPTTGIAPGLCLDGQGHLPTMDLWSGFDITSGGGGSAVVRRRSLNSLGTRSGSRSI